MMIYLKIFNMQRKQKALFLFMLLRKKEKAISLLKVIQSGTWHGTGPYKIETGDFVKTASNSPMHGVHLSVKR